MHQQLIELIAIELKMPLVRITVVADRRKNPYALDQAQTLASKSNGFLESLSKTANKWEIEARFVIDYETLNQLSTVPGVTRIKLVK